MNNIGFLELLLATLVAAFGGAHAAFKARRPETIGIIDVGVWFVAVFFGVGPWVAVLAGGVLPEQASSVVATAYFGVILFIVGMLCADQLIGLFVKRRHRLEAGEDRRGLAPIMAQVGNVNAPLLLTIYALAIVIKLYIGFKYRLFFSGDQESKLIPIPYVVRSALDLSLIVMDATFLWASVMFCARGRYRHVAGVVIVVGLLLAFTVGRRWLVADMFLLSLCYYMYRGLSVRVFVVSIFLVAVLLYAAMPFFWRVRYYRQQETMDTNAVGTVVTAAVRAATDWDNQQLREAYNQNLASRPVFIRFNMAIVAAQQSQPYMMGLVTKSTLLWTLPSALYADKLLMSQTEQEIQEFYGMPYEDASSNWPAYGQADLGLLGTLLAGVIFALVIGTMEVVAIRVGWRVPFLGILFTAAMLACAMAVEETPIYLLRNLRDSVIMSIPFIIGAPFLGGRRGTGHGRGGPHDGGWASGYGVEGGPVA